MFLIGPKASRIAAAEVLATSWFERVLREDLYGR